MYRDMLVVNPALVTSGRRCMKASPNSAPAENATKYSRNFLIVTSFKTSVRTPANDTMLTKTTLRSDIVTGSDIKIDRMLLNLTLIVNNLFKFSHPNLISDLMAKIISMSLSEGLLKEVDSLEGFSGRSEAIRSGVRLLLDDLKEKERLKGHAECVLIMMHDKHYENAFIKTKHKYEDIISTQVHSNLCHDKCLELFVLHGSAGQITSFMTDIRKNKRADYVKLVVP